MRLNIFFILILVSSCVNGIIMGTDESSRFKLSAINQGEIPFSMIQQMILSPSCVQCHSWAADEQQVLRRIVVGNPSASPLFTEIDSGRMPQGLPRLPQTTIDLLRKYIEGFQGQPVPSVPMTGTYKSVRYHLLETSCLSCHNAAEAARRHIPNLDEKQKVKDLADDILYTITTGREIDDGPMPPFGNSAPVPTDAVIVDLQHWISAGFPD